MIPLSDSNKFRNPLVSKPAFISNMCICKLQPWQTATHSFGKCYTRKIISNDFHWLFFWSSLSMGFRKLCSGIKKQVHVFHNFKSCIDLNAALKLRYTVIPFGIGCILKLYYFNLSTFMEQYKSKEHLPPSLPFFCLAFGVSSISKVSNGKLSGKM